MGHLLATGSLASIMRRDGNPWHGACIAARMPAFRPGRRAFVRAAASSAALLLPLRHAAGAASPPTLVVLPPDFLDDHANPDPEVVAAQQRRLAHLHVQLQSELQSAGLYRVMDLAPAAALVAAARETHEAVYRCEECVIRIGRAVGASYAMATWVQKVSELILNVNVELWRLSDERSLFARSVDLRGNQDASWERAVTFLVRRLAERRAEDPGFGL
jgi:hypothetical protein